MMVVLQGGKVGGGDGSGNSREVVKCWASVDKLGRVKVQLFNHGDDIFGVI